MGILGAREGWIENIYIHIHIVIYERGIGGKEKFHWFLFTLSVLNFRAREKYRGLETSDALIRSRVGV